MRLLHNVGLMFNLKEGGLSGQIATLTEDTDLSALSVQHTSSYQWPSLIDHLLLINFIFIFYSPSSVEYRPLFIVQFLSVTFAHCAAVHAYSWMSVT
jgi:hypothetical protein